MWNSFTSAVILMATLSAGQDENTYVRVSQGLMKGKLMTSRNGNKFYGFFKVPYARPPLNDLRFQGPEEPESWEGVRDASQEHNTVCVQRNVFVESRFFIAGEEDCLYMNIYTPKVNVTDDRLLPVMVFIHGGGWTCGSGNSFYYSPHYLLDKDIVYVAFNYRLGPIGFLSMEDEELPGNYGLKDQSQALRWIQKNIRDFGGDPDSVTIFGESAGGASVHYHIISPMSKGLFHRGISQSGTALCSWALGYPGVTRRNTIKMAESLGCPASPTKALIDCLRKKSPEEIVGTDVLFMEWFKEPMIPFKPVVEKRGKEEKFLPDHPEQAIAAGRVADVPWITGLNSGDGALKSAAIYNDIKLVEELDKNFNEIVPASLFYRESAADVLEISKLIRKFYFGEKAISNETAQEVTDLWTDGWFLDGANNAVRLMRNKRTSPVYYYYMSYRGTVSYSSIFGDDTRDYGVCHADELIYMFPFEHFLPNVTYSESDKKYMTLMLDLWTNFARFGEPTPHPSDIKWSPVATDNLEYLHLGKRDVKMEANLLPERTDFWNFLNSKRKPLLKDEL